MNASNGRGRRRDTMDRSGTRSACLALVASLLLAGASRPESARATAPGRAADPTALASQAPAPPAPPAGPQPAGPQPPAPAPPAASAPGGETPPGQPPGGAAPPASAAATEKQTTAGGALELFMEWRDYRTIRELKSAMTASLGAVYDHDPRPFNGSKGAELAAWDFREPSLKPAATSCSVPVRSLWEWQGEAVEERNETIRLARQADGRWLVSERVAGPTESVRFRDSVNGVTTVRMVLRAWQRRALDAARPHLTDAFVKKDGGRTGGLEALFGGSEAERHRAAFRIVSVKADGPATATAEVRLVEVPPGRPAALEGTPHVLALVRRGSRWLVDDWK